MIMRVLFTSLFFVLVAFLTLASHPPVEKISRTFGGGAKAENDQPIADGSSSPTGIIPLSDPVEPSQDSVTEPQAIPEPIAVPEVEIVEVPESETEIEVVEVETATLVAIEEEEIAAAPEAIELPEEEPSNEMVATNESDEPSPAAQEAAPEAPAMLSENTDTPEYRQYVRSLNLYAVFFNAGETDLPQDSRGEIAKAVNWLANIPDGLDVIVGGYADTFSEAADAKEIGELRADAVYDALVAAGAPADRLQVAHYRSTKKRVASDAWRDRRVEFHVLPPR